MEITFLDEQFCCWGHGAQGGSYLLRLIVNQPLSVGFGRFQAGESIAVPRGDYFYVGSARAQKGATSLARRLLRHASRSDGQNPQPIRQKMLTLFPKIGLGPTPLHPPMGKRLRWHVDFLLEEQAAELTAVYLIRTPQENLPEVSSQKLLPGSNLREVGRRGLETAVARWLLDLPEVAPLVPGLGATDDPGGSHLLRVTAVSDWWSSFPAELSTFFKSSTWASAHHDE